MSDSIISACRMRWHSSGYALRANHLLTGDGPCRSGDPLVWPIFAMGISGLGHMINRRVISDRCCLAPVNVCCCRLAASHSGGINSLYRRRRHAGSCGQTVSGALTIFQAQLSCPTLTVFLKAPRVSFRKVKCLRSRRSARCSVSYVSLRAPGKSHKIKGLLISGLIACVVGGTTNRWNSCSCS